MKINTVIEGDRAVYSKLDAWNKALVEDIAEHIAILTKQLEALVRSNAPVGRGNHGGKLRESVHSSVRRNVDTIAGIVTASVPYLPVIEFGLHKSESIGAHERRLDHAWARDIDPITVTVDPYVRQADFEATLFMQRALDTISSEVVEELQQVIDSHSGEIKE